jgi:hypothetical protein
MATFKHNKKRDTGLVYEFLVRRLSKAMLEKDNTTTRKALDIVHKYYGEGTPLAQERELFDVIKNTRGVTEASARRIMLEVQKAARELDVKKIDIKKSNLIKEINYTFGKDFFSEHRIPEYRLLASIQMVIDSSRTQTRLTESVQKIQLEEGLIRYMTTRGSFQETVAVKSEVDALVMAMVAKRFNEKYSKSLIGPQKVLLEKFIRAQVTGDRKPLTEYLTSEQARISQALAKARDLKEVVEDKKMAEKLDEAAGLFNKIIGKGDDAVEEIMTYQKLVEEVQSND